MFIPEERVHIHIYKRRVQHLIRESIRREMCIKGLISFVGEERVLIQWYYQKKGMFTPKERVNIYIFGYAFIWVIVFVLGLIAFFTKKKLNFCLAIKNFTKVGITLVLVIIIITILLRLLWMKICFSILLMAEF